MAKTIIVLDTQQLPGGVSQINCIFWFPVQAGREVLIPSATSVWKGASAAEIGQLQQGQVVEEQFQLQAPPGVSSTTIKAQLQSAYTNRKAIFDAKPNPNSYYGVYFDGAAWSA